MAVLRRFFEGLFTDKRSALETVPVVLQMALKQQPGMEEVQSVDGLLPDTEWFYRINLGEAPRLSVYKVTPEVLSTSSNVLSQMMIEQSDSEKVAMWASTDWPKDWSLVVEVDLPIPSIPISD